MGPQRDPSKLECAFHGSRRNVDVNILRACSKLLPIIRTVVASWNGLDPGFGISQPNFEIWDWRFRGSLEEDYRVGYGVFSHSGLVIGTERYPGSSLYCDLDLHRRVRSLGPVSNLDPASGFYSLKYLAPPAPIPQFPCYYEQIADVDG